MRIASSIRVAMLSVGAWWEMSSALLAFSDISPLMAIVRPLAFVGFAHAAAACWAFLCSVLGHPVTDYVAAYFYFNFSLKAFKDLSEGLAVSWLKRDQPRALRVSAVLVLANAFVFAVLSHWFGQLMLEVGIDIALSLSALGNILKFTVKLHDRLVVWYMTPA